MENPDLPDPGTKIEHPIPSIVCATINNPKERVVIPAVVVDMIQKASGIVEILWPLGIYVGFTSEGMTVGIYGRKEDGEVTHGVSQKAINEYEVPDVGEVLWEMWKRLRMPPYSMYYVMMGNYHNLLNETKTRHNLP